MKRLLSIAGAVTTLAALATPIFSSYPGAAKWVAMAGSVAAALGHSAVAPLPPARVQ